MQEDDGIQEIDGFVGKNATNNWVLDLALEDFEETKDVAHPPDKWKHKKIIKSDDDELESETSEIKWRKYLPILCKELPPW